MLDTARILVERNEAFDGAIIFSGLLHHFDFIGSCSLMCVNSVEWRRG